MPAPGCAGRAGRRLGEAPKAWHARSKQSRGSQAQCRTSNRCPGGPPRRCFRGAADLRTGKTEIFEAPLDDSWARDIGPSFLVGAEGERAGIAWRFNAWGGQIPALRGGPAFGGAGSRQRRLTNISAPLVCEGGAIHLDGDGALITTEQSLLNPNRNPGLTRREIEERDRALYRRRQHPLAGRRFSDEETDGHIDNIACFAAPGRVMLGVPADQIASRFRTGHGSDPRALAEARDARGPRARDRRIGPAAETARRLARPAAGRELCQFLSGEWRPW